MNHLVPNFHVMEEDDSIHAHSRFKIPSTGEEELMELLWQNGQVVVHSQNQRPALKNSSTAAADLPTEKEIRSNMAENLFMHEDEMASWLQYPLDDSSFDRDFYSDLIYSAPPPPPVPITTTTNNNNQPKAVAEFRPPRPPPPDNPPRQHNFVHFSRLAARESATVVESNETPAVGRERESRPPVNERGGNTSAVGGTCELTVTSSPGSSRTRFSGETRPLQEKPPLPPAAAGDRKRKGREGDVADCQCEDINLEAKKQARGSASTKRSRAVEVHNLSERRRRDRINEKMRALQELIPRCNKSDKASMLDEAIEYLKSLQLLVQMMSMGHVMIPMVYPAGMQQYMPGMGMGLGIGMYMALTRPMIPYPSTIPSLNAAAKFPMSPQFPEIVPAPATDKPMNATIAQSQNHLRLPNFVDPYRQYLCFRHSQLPLPHNQTGVLPSASKASTSKDIGNPVNYQSG